MDRDEERRLAERVIDQARSRSFRDVRVEDFEWDETADGRHHAMLGPFVRGRAPSLWVRMRRYLKERRQA